MTGKHNRSDSVQSGGPVQKKTTFASEDILEDTESSLSQTETFDIKSSEDLDDSIIGSIVACVMEEYLICQT